MHETAFDVVEEIVRLLQETETHALMGERQSALESVLEARALLAEFYDTIQSFPEGAFLKKRIDTIANQLCTEMHANL